MLLPRLKVLLTAVTAMAVAAAAIGLWHLRGSVRHALDTPADSASRPLEFVALTAPETPLEVWGDGTVEAAALTPAGIVTAGGSGVFEAHRRVQGLPTLRASALALWRGRPVVALATGGVFRRGPVAWEEVLSGWGTLHVRTLAESAAGELLIGAREGLFRAAWSSGRLEKLDAHPVRALASGAGYVLSGGEEGLYRVEPSRVLRVETPDPWVESLALDGDVVFAVTAVGLASGALDGAVQPVGGLGDVASGVLHDGVFYGVTEPPSDAVRRRDRSGRVSEERLEAPVRRLMTASGALLADTDAGLFRRTAAGWALAAARPAALPPGAFHVGALARLGDRLVAGSFDGGLAVGERAGQGDLEWRAVPGSDAWGINALLPAGGVVYVASLRGAARFDGVRLRPIEGPGAAFALASTPEGVAIGYGHGVQLPGPRLLSAFHGLPGNQAYALASGVLARGDTSRSAKTRQPSTPFGASLFVGTPSGLGVVEGRRVRARVTAGEGKLPHPWVTALVLSGDALYVGTYGGGVARRTAALGVVARATLVDGGRYEPFVETQGLKVSAGCLVEAAGRVYVGTEGKGLHRLTRDGARFVPLRLPLPSPRVTALLAVEDALYVGTEEGLARLPLSVGEID